MNEGGQMDVNAIGGAGAGGAGAGGHRRALCWVRRDLRLRDHRALFEACEAADEVAVVFVFDSEILGALKDSADTRVTFIHRSLVEMDSKLRAMGSRLVCVYGNPVELIPDVAKKLGATLVVASHDREPYAMERDDEVRARLAAVEVGGLDAGGIGMVTFKDHVIFESGEVMNQAGLPFRVYTPYSKTWRANFVEAVHAAEYVPNNERLVGLEALNELLVDGGRDGIPTLESMGFVEAEPWLPAG
ncbi:MAG: deoxyribodipyrimidine photo-lyase, partial [Armatimonadota bacterium]